MILTKLCSLFLVLSINFTSIYGLVGGDEAQPGEYTYTVAIFNIARVIIEELNTTEEVRDFKCTGAIIDEQFILTAAHCVLDPETSQFNKHKYKILVSTTDFSDYVNLNDNPEEIEVAVEKIYVPSDCDLSIKKSDIAVLKLARSLNLEKHKLQKLNVPLDNNKDHYKVGTAATVTGFGAKSAEFTYNGTKKELVDFDLDGKLRSANMEIVDNSEFEKIPEKVDSESREYHILAKMIKQSNEEYGQCYGDGGGPMVYKSNIVIGVAVEMFDDCDERKYPAMYIKVADYLNFIKDAMNDSVNENIRVRVI